MERLCLQACIVQSIWPEGININSLIPYQSLFCFISVQGGRVVVDAFNIP